MVQGKHSSGFLLQDWSLGGVAGTLLGAAVCAVAGGILIHSSSTGGTKASVSLSQVKLPAVWQLQENSEIYASLWKAIEAAKNIRLTEAKVALQPSQDFPHARRKKVSKHVLSAPKHFPKKAVLSMVRQEPSAEFEQRKLQDMHRFLTSRMIIALHTSVLHAQLEVAPATPVADDRFLSSQVTHQMATQGLEIRSDVAHSDQPRVSGRRPASFERPVVEEVKKDISKEVEATLSWHQGLSQGFLNAVSDVKQENLATAVKKSNVSAGEAISLENQTESLIEIENPMQRKSLTDTVHLTAGLVADSVYYNVRRTAEDSKSGFHLSQRILGDESNQWVSENRPQYDAHLASEEMGEVHRQLRDGGSVKKVESAHVDSQMRDLNTQEVASFPVVVGPHPLPETNVASSMNSQSLAIHDVHSKEVATRQSTQENSENTPNNSDSLAAKKSVLKTENLEVPEYVEAFDLNRTPIDPSNVDLKVISSENGANDLNRGYRWVGSDNHWPTLEWVDSGNNGNRSIPLVGHNNLRYLSAVTRLEDQRSENGFVFGKIARGWELEESTEARNLVYLYGRDVRDSSGGLVRREGTVINSEDLRSGSKEVGFERYFLAFNIAPGAHLLKFKSIWGEGTGALAVPVLAGAGVHCDLTEISRRTLRAHIFGVTEEREDGKLESPLELRVVGQEGTQREVYNSTQDFVLPNVVVVGNYPFYLQVSEMFKPADVFQYRVLPSQMDGYTVFRISSEMADHWETQLAAQHSETAVVGKNLLVAAVPGLVKKNDEENPNESLRSALKLYHGSGQFTKASTYTIYPWPQKDSPYDEVHFDLPLKAERSRFASRLSDGVAVAEVYNKDGESLWSELSLIWSDGAQLVSGTLPGSTGNKRTIQVVGPY